MGFELLRFGAPVAFAALGESIGQRAGVLNIGLEGFMLVGAYVAFRATSVTGNPYLGLLAGVGAGVILALIQGFFTIQNTADQVVVGTAVNLLALGLTNTLFRAQFGKSGELVRVPSLPAVVGPFDVGLILLLLLVVGLSLWLARSKWGLANRAVGEYPPAVQSAGLSVTRIRWQASLLAGAFAGLAGAYLVVGVALTFAENMVAGRGFVAIAMVTFGRWRPWGVVLASLFVGYIDSLQYQWQGRSVLPVELFQALPYLGALLVLVFVGRGAAAPAALGVPYRRER